ncbi:MAG: glutaredoxin family protein, partial [Janthinobacterium lividum]
MPPTPTFHFILYTRAWCHLCETMLTELQAIKGSQPWQIDYIDIDATSTLNPELTERYDQL